MMAGWTLATAVLDPSFEAGMLATRGWSVGPNGAAV
jgi:hypothetical protein